MLGAVYGRQISTRLVHGPLDTSQQLAPSGDHQQYDLSIASEDHEPVGFAVANQTATAWANNLSPFVLHGPATAADVYKEHQIFDLGHPIGDKDLHL